MIRAFLIGLALLSYTSILAQKPFSGKLVYKASHVIPDSIKMTGKTWYVTLYTNDTIVRTETETNSLGNQVYIRNMNLNKAYLLLQLEDKKFAIQTDLSKKNDSVVDRGYSVKKKGSGKKILRLKTKRYWIQDKEEKGYFCYFAKKLGNKYLQVYPEVKYLAVDYFLPTHEGLVHYELIDIKYEQVDRNLFGIPSDYKKISFEEFVRLYYDNAE
jgi:hypothetical protein